MGQDDATAFAGGRAMLRLAASRLGIADAEGVAAGGYQLLLAAYGRDIDVHTTLYDGAVAAVDRLRATGCATGICTNKPEYLAEILMRRLGVRDVFGSLIGADTLPVRKPDPEPFFEAVRRAGGNTQRSCLIGDTITDHSTARAAGVPSVLVTFGPGASAGQADIRALEPDALLDHFDELPALAKRLLGE